MQTHICTSVKTFVHVDVMVRSQSKQMKTEWVDAWDYVEHGELKVTKRYILYTHVCNVYITLQDVQTNGRNDTTANTKGGYAEINCMGYP